jgi:hypothetical protein
MLSQKPTLGFAVLTLLACSLPSLAQTNNANAGHLRAPASVSPATAFTTNAKLALSWSPFGGTLRSKGVKSVTNPTTGVICITPSVSLNLAKIYPLVSVEWGESSGNALLAFWRDTSIDNVDCGAGKLEVQTFDFNGGGSPIASQSVAFDLVIE